MPLPKFIVRLTDEERTQLDDLIRTGKRAASVLIHARILLRADAGAGGSGWDGGRIAEVLDCGESTVYRGRRAFVERGLEAATLVWIDWFNHRRLLEPIDLPSCLLYTSRCV